MRRVPIAATVVVALAVAAMIALGFWQLARREQKAALLARYAANRRLPAIPLPPHAGDSLLFRQVRLRCTDPAPLPREAGRDADGGSGWRVLYRCGDGTIAQMGVADRPVGAAGWPGGPVSGFLTHAPQHRSLIANAFAPASPAPMVMAAVPLTGLRANPAANLDDVPNNHLAYAVQWFVFAGIAAAIYALALRRRAVVRGAARG